MPKFKVRVWYPMEAEITIDAEDETEAEQKAKSMASTLDYEDTGDLYAMADEVDDGHGLDDSIIGSLP